MTDGEPYYKMQIGVERWALDGIDTFESFRAKVDVEVEGALRDLWNYIQADRKGDEAEGAARETSLP